MSSETSSEKVAFFRRRPVVLALLIAGSLVVVAHVLGAIWLGMTLSNWMSGAAIGLILIIFALAHLLIPGHTRNRVVNMNNQFLYWCISALAGIVVGLIAVLLIPYIGWFFVIVAIVGAISVGRLFDGNPKTKAFRLMIYGFIGGITYFSFVAPDQVVANIGIALFCGVIAIIVGLITHLTVGPPKPKVISGK
jgi:hypothetical protein